MIFLFNTILQFNMALQELHQYASSMENFIVSEKERINTRYDERINDVEDDEEWQWLVDSTADAIINFSDVFPTILRSSLLSHVYSVIEINMMEMCKHLQTKNQYTLTVKDITGNGIEKAKVYLEKVCGLKGFDDSREWELIRVGYNRVRNVFVHNGGVLPNDKAVDEFRAKTNGIPHMELDGKKIILERDFSLEFISIAQRFITHLMQSNKGTFIA